MDMALLGTATAFGLAASAGLNTTLPLLIVGVLARAGLLTLAAPYDALSSDIALGGLALLALLEFVGDKIPGIDSIVQAIQWPAAAAAGAILFASQTSVITGVSPGLTILVGLLTAGAVHGVRTSARPAVTMLSAGTGNVATSLAEDVYAVLLASTSALLPAVGLILLVVLLVVSWLVATWTARSGRRASKWLRGRFSTAPSDHER